MLAVYEAQRYKINLKSYFLHSHVDPFPVNLRTYTKKQGVNLTMMLVIQRDDTKKDETYIYWLISMDFLVGKRRWNAEEGSDEQQEESEKCFDKKSKCNFKYIMKEELFVSSFQIKGKLRILDSNKILIFYRCCDFFM